jgi:hypothetical protein
MSPEFQVSEISQARNQSEAGSKQSVLHIELKPLRLYYIDEGKRRNSYNTLYYSEVTDLRGDVGKMQVKATSMLVFRELSSGPNTQNETPVTCKERDS